MCITFFLRNLPYCITEADSWQICTWWISRQQCSGHKCPSHHWWAERQQTTMLSKPVTPNRTFPHLLSHKLYFTWFLLYSEHHMLLLSLYLHVFRSLWDSQNSFRVYIPCSIVFSRVTWTKVRFGCFAVVLQNQDWSRRGGEEMSFLVISRP